MKSWKEKALRDGHLFRAYEHIGQPSKACNESLHQLVETTENQKGKKQNTQIKDTLTETVRLCKK